MTPTERGVMLAWLDRVSFAFTAVLHEVKRHECTVPASDCMLCAAFKASTDAIVEDGRTLILPKRRRRHGEARV